MKSILFVLLFLVPLLSIAQDSTKSKSPPPKELWIPSAVWKGYPVRDPSEGHAESTWGYIDGYDTVLCKYKLVGDTTVYTGLKLFYRKDGYLVDTKSTIQVFFNLQRRRVDYVSSYAIIER